MISAILALATAAIWIYLISSRGGFWRAAERDVRFAPDTMPAPAVWPSVTAIVPARNEADVIAESIGSLLAQSYPGPFAVVLVDDQSSDGKVKTRGRKPKADTSFDDAELEAEALAAGMSIEDYKEFKRLEAEEADKTK